MVAPSGQQAKRPSTCLSGDDLRGGSPALERKRLALGLLGQEAGWLAGRQAGKPGQQAAVAASRRKRWKQRRRADAASRISAPTATTTGTMAHQRHPRAPASHRFRGRSSRSSVGRCPSSMANRGPCVWLRMRHGHMGAETAGVQTLTGWRTSRDSSLSTTHGHDEMRG